MRQGQQHRRGRGRNTNNGGGPTHHQASNTNNNRKGQNPLTRSFESNGPDVKIRGTPAHVAEKYVALARDAQTSGDPVLAENYLQHAEHYYRIILAYREQQGGEAGAGGAGMMRPRQSGDPSVDGDFSDEDGDDFSGDGQPVMRNEAPQPGGFDTSRFDDRPQMHDNNPNRNQQQNRPNNRDRQNGDRPDGGEPRRFQNDRPNDRQNDRPNFRGNDGRGNETRGDGRSDNRRDQPFRSDNRQDRFERPERAPDRIVDRGPDRGGEQPNAEFRSEREPRPQRFERPDRAERPERFERPERVERQEPADRPAPIAVPVLDPVAADAPRRREPRVAPVPAHEQPEFLRRPVRRPRREAVAETADEAPSDDSGNQE